MAGQPTIATPRPLSPARLKYKHVGFGDISHDRQQPVFTFHLKLSRSDGAGGTRNDRQVRCCHKRGIAAAVNAPTVPRS